MTTIRTLRKLTKVAAELEQVAKVIQSLAPALQGAAEAAAPLAEAARSYRPGYPYPTSVKGRIERV